MQISSTLLITDFDLVNKNLNFINKIHFFFLINTFLTHTPANFVSFERILFKNNKFFKLTSSNLDSFSHQNYNLDLFFLQTHDQNVFNDFESNFYSNYSYLAQKSFIDFFMKNSIDVPICFKKSNSLKFKNFDLPIVRLINFLMKKGKKEQTTRCVLTGFFYFIKKLKKSTSATTFLINSWLIFFRLFYVTNFFFLNCNFNEENLRYKAWLANEQFFFFKSTQNTAFSSSLVFHEDGSLSFNDRFFIKSFFIDCLKKILPLFFFYIYNVDKNVKKFSRGKSGKYVFIWKYVPEYKRLKTIIKLISKQVKFYQKKNFIERLVLNFSHIYFKNKKSFVYKTKTFSYNYVFKNFKRTLMKNYLTIAI